MQPTESDHSQNPESGTGPGKTPMPRALVRPHHDRLDPAVHDYEEVCARHEAAVAAGEPLYLDPTTGLWVMTAAMLWERACCDNGCRHCPHLARDL